ncbi:putative ATP-binding protein involved in virulence [Paenibacillus sp. PastF-3]|uniref:AAA family ATPase n=1 Tax=Paenibacillus sp. PastF-3 TaxID=2940626 RepID=UPI002477147D|nr:AAA family ATPase [Paenibacillus sp. PastF-3]MDH6374930.1 putative ATP-binding protein involved in virulence [Paenibacillus sp. PastF-3]
MRLDKLWLKNFRNFSNTELKFMNNFTVIVGENGTGKTAIMDGISIVISELIAIFAKEESRKIDHADIFLKRNIHQLTIEPRPMAVIECLVKFENEWSIYLDDDIDKFWASELVDRISSVYGYSSVYKLADEVEFYIDLDIEFPLPIFVYYHTNRLWTTSDSEYTEKLNLDSRYAGYSNFLKPTTNESEFKKWFIKMSMINLNEKPSNALTSVKTAIKKCLERAGIIDIYYEHLTNEIILIFGEEVIPFYLLSDGYRSMISMVADIAYRMTILNPFLDDHLKTHGIVLIDELDLHLHPKWQRNIVEDLKSTFPNVQFITTTHSPFIVQSLQPGELLLLGEHTDESLGLASPQLFVNKSLEDVSTNIMGIKHPQRNQKLQDLFNLTKEYYSMIKEKIENPEQTPILDPSINELKSRIDELTVIFSDNIAFHAILELEKEELERKGKNK